MEKHSVELMDDFRTAPAGPGASRRQIVSRFVVFSAFAGLLLGIFEAALLRTSPIVPALLVPDIGSVEWFLAPLVDIACFALLGLVLGLLAGRTPGRHRIRWLVAAEGAAVMAFVALRVRWLHARIVIREYHLRDILVPLAAFAAALAVAAVAVYLLWKPVSRLAARSRFGWVRCLSWSVVAAVLVALCGIAYSRLEPFRSPARAQANAKEPNVIFIVLDTVRADHLSAYGYQRPTTPNLDRLARRGVLFENALSATSWTLASHAAMFTGLLPHQNGADWWLPLPPGPRTLAGILQSRGYETAGFAANFNYCQRGWGIGRGFEIYRDDSESLSRNLAGTLLGTALIQPTYESFCRFDYLERQDARQTNNSVLRWLRQPPSSPFFLFINYFDTHVPYLTEASYNHRFGAVSNRLVHKLFRDLQGPAPARDITPAERAALMAGYDNCLAFLDAQIGHLLDFLEKSPEGRNTIVIITSDHGEAFGEQGFYSHGYNLYRELLHVPLIIAGPGIPRDVRISHIVRTRDLFSTVLDLAGGGHTPFSRESLARFWNPGFTPQPFDNFVISELVPIFNETGTKAMISLTTPEWQYIYDSSGRSELYNWPADPLDQHDLAGSPGAQDTIESLHQRLIQLVAASSEPWRDQNYLFVHSTSPRSFLLDVIAERKKNSNSPSPGQTFIGASQAHFAPEESPSPARPAQPDRETLQSLPYH
ncbi:MAG TPA: sulfatase [Terriglobia bacterium]|nr:sulfatase [Terriglobia bacterium]